MELAGRSVLVTGGAGFIGSHLVDALAGARVRVIDDLSTGRRANLAGTATQLELIEGDLREPGLLAAAMDGIEVVFHLACRGVRHSLGHPRENHEINAGGTLRVLEEALRAGVRRVIHVSSSEVYGTARFTPMSEDHPCQPETIYGAAKLAGEAYARAFHRSYGLATTVVRPFNNFGPRSHHEGDSGEVIPRFAVWALNGRRPVIFGDGQQTRDFIYVGDTAHWLVRLAACDEAIGATVNLGSGRETSVAELARLVAQAAAAEGLEPEHRPPRPGDVRRHVADVARARQLVGFEVRTRLPEGIGRLVAHLRGQPGGPAALLAAVDEQNWIGVSSHRA